MTTGIYSERIDTRGGGVLIAIRKHFNFTLIDVVPENLEQVWVKVKFSNFAIYFSIIYVSPLSSVETYCDNVSVIDKKTLQTLK